MRILSRVVTVTNLSRSPGHNIFCPRKAWDTYLQHPRLYMHTRASPHQTPPPWLIGAPHCSPGFLQQGGPHPITRKEQARPPHLWAGVTLGGWTAGAQSCRSLFCGPWGSSGDPHPPPCLQALATARKNILPPPGLNRLRVSRDLK